jgi:hypothetical protein
LRESGLKPAQCSRISYSVQGAPGVRRIHLYKGWSDDRLLALVATEQDGQLLHVRRMHAR